MIFHRFWKLLTSGMMKTALVIFSIPILLALLPEAVQHHFTIPAYLLLVGLLVYVVTPDHSQHRKAPLGEKLQWLRSIGFSIEQLGKYWGLKGEYRGYFIRVYVDPSHLSGLSRRYEMDICIIVYFHHNVRLDPKLSFRIFRRLQNDMENSVKWFRGEKLSAHEIHLRQYTSFSPFTTPHKIQKRLDGLIDLLEKHKLQPLAELDVEGFIQAQPHLHGPPIKTFQENFIKSDATK